MPNLLFYFIVWIYGKCTSLHCTLMCCALATYVPTHSHTHTKYIHDSVHHNNLVNKVPVLVEVKFCLCSD